MIIYLKSYHTMKHCNRLQVVSSNKGASARDPLTTAARPWGTGLYIANL